MKPRLTREQKETILEGINWVVLLMVVLQLWLLTATMNAWLGGDASVVWPAALASLACFAVNLGLLRHVYRLERPEAPAGAPAGNALQLALGTGAFACCFAI